LSGRDLRHQRKRWKKNQRTKRSRDKVIKEHLQNMDTPPQSPDHGIAPPENDIPPPENGIPPVQRQGMRNVGRKRVRKDRAKAYRQIYMLRIQLKTRERLKEKYKKRNQRLEKKRSHDRAREEDRLLNSHDQRKSLLLFNIILHRLRKRYKKTKSNKERKLISGLICSHTLMRKYRLVRFTGKLFGFTNYRLNGSTTG
jgi:hypothetical protein